jgi:IclR family pca regulon transcriptional regulator
MPRTASSTLDPVWSIPALREPRYSQSLERGLAILGCFTPKRQVLGIADIADELGMSRSTTHRYVITLVALGYLEQQLPGRKYRLGLRVTDLGMSALNGTGLREHAHPYLEQLRREVDFPITLGVLDGTEALVVDSLESIRRALRENPLGVSIGSRLPLYCTAMGKLLLANLPGPQRNELFGSLKLNKHGPHAIKSKTDLRLELESLEALELVVDNEEFASEMFAIAVPVRNEAGEVTAALEMRAHSTMTTAEDMVDKLGPHLLSAAGRISARLGYRREDEKV